MKGLFNKWFSVFNKDKPKPVTYFVHVPKTAGTSFIVLLDRFFSASKIFPHQLWREIKQIDAEQNAQFDLYRGHLGGGGVAVLSDRPVEFLTILRNPHELARSTYEFVLREPNTKVHQLVKGQTMSLAQFISHKSTQPLIKNRMVRNISFDFKQDPAAQEVFLSSETIEYLQSMMNNADSSITDEKRLERAKKFIDNTRWFGLLERFDESMQLLCYVMCWPPIGPSQKLNTNKQKASIPSDVIEQLTAINQQDIQLHEYGQCVFAERWQVMLDELQAYQGNQQLSIDELIDQHYQSQHQGQLLNYIKYDFGQVLLGSQWHRREIMQPESEYFRWTGPHNKAHIDFWLKPDNYQISIRIINAVSTTVLDELQVELNGSPLSWQTDDRGVVRLLNLSSSEDLIGPNGLARLSFEIPTVMSHQAAFKSDDQRLVGIAVHWIQFKHV